MRGTFASCSAASRSARCILDTSISFKTYFCPSALQVTKYAAPKLPLPSICPLVYLSAMAATADTPLTSCKAGCSGAATCYAGQSGSATVRFYRFVQNDKCWVVTKHAHLPFWQNQTNIHSVRIHFSALPKGSSTFMLCFKYSSVAEHGIYELCVTSSINIMAIMSFPFVV